MRTEKRAKVSILHRVSPNRCFSILGGQSGVAVTRSHGKDQDVGSNPATARNQITHIRQTPAQKVPQLCGRISVEDRRCKAELDL